MKNSLRRLNAMLKIFGIDAFYSLSVSQSVVNGTAYLSFDLIRKITKLKFIPDHGPDYLFFKRGHYWIFVFNTHNTQIP